MSFQTYTRTEIASIRRARRPRAVARAVAPAPGLGLMAAIVLGAATWAALAFALGALF